MLVSMTVMNSADVRSKRRRSAVRKTRESADPGSTSRHYAWAQAARPELATMKGTLIQDDPAMQFMLQDAPRPSGRRMVGCPRQSDRARSLQHRAESGSRSFPVAASRPPIELPLAHNDAP
jgi:hypothetical protein